MRRRALAIGAVAIIAITAAVLFPWRGGEENSGPDYLGYVEGESLLIGPKATGRIVGIEVREGDIVAAGALLYRLDDDMERGRLAEAEARLAKAKAQLADLEAAQQRPEQIDVLRAARRQAEAALALSRTEAERQRKLFERKITSEARLQQAEAAFERDRAALREVTQQIEAARLAGREDQIAAAKAEVAAADAALRQACVALDDRTVSAPRAGRVLDVFFRPGEVAAAGQPVLELLPPENVLVRFYVPEPRLAGITRGQRIAVACDHCPPDLQAEVSFISPEAEYTPPVIFSREERAKLVFLVEARPIEPSGVLKPGLPVRVTLGPGGVETHAGN